MRYFALISIFIFLQNCKKTAHSTIDLGLSYYPLNVGDWIVYNVDSIVYNDFTNPVSIDTFSYQIREEITNDFLDLNNEQNFRIEQFKKYANGSWFVNNVFSAKQNQINTQKVENDLRYVKMVFPIKTGSNWNGHIYLDVADQAHLAFLNLANYNWNFSYENINETLIINNFTLDSCVTILQINEENLFEKKYAKEIYAKNIGLVYKEMRILETQAAPTSVPFEERAEKGFILIYTLSNYNH